MSRSAPPRLLWRTVLLWACGVVSCAPRGAVSPALPTQVEWTAARAWLGDLRQTEPPRPFGAVVRVSLREPHTGKTLTARGAVAVDPGRALRMILLGPAGSTALDVWATPERWRFDIPPADIHRRGGLTDDPTLPVGFFRWWFLGPASGRLLASFPGPVAARGPSTRFILRQGSATIDIVDARVGSGHDVNASRRVLGTVDRIVFHGRSLSITPGDHATYDQESSGVHVEVTVESASDAPDPAAFDDPDAPQAPPRASGS